MTTRDRDYKVYYQYFTSELYSSMRSESYLEDFGQCGWLISTDLRQITEALGLAPGQRLLDVGCGAAGPLCHLVQTTGCTAVGIDLSPEAIAIGIDRAATSGLEERVSFRVANGDQPIDEPDASFDSVLCVDAIEHFRDRRRVLTDWARLLKPGGRVWLSDPGVITGFVSNAEIMARSLNSYFLFSIPGATEQAITSAGLELLSCHDLTENVAVTAQRRHAARARRKDELCEIEGKESFESQQDLLVVAGLLAEERRLGRYAYIACKPTSR
jgi:cyclopropane fatty-acyl-phospholipid synthase-like methyltransferase